MINLQETGLSTLIKKGYELLELETFFTSGLDIASITDAIFDAMSSRTLIILIFVFLS